MTDPLDTSPSPAESPSFCEPVDLFNRYWWPSAVCFDVRSRDAFDADHVHNSVWAGVGAALDAVRAPFMRALGEPISEVFLLDATGSRDECVPPTVTDVLLLTAVPVHSSLTVRRVRGGYRAVREHYPFMCTAVRPKCVRLPYPQQIAPHLFLGSWMTARTESVLRDLGITAVVIAARECRPALKHALPELEYLHLPLEDASHQVLQPELVRAHLFVERMRRSGRRVLVHCQLGVCRSAAVVVAHLLWASAAKGAWHTADAVAARRTGRGLRLKRRPVHASSPLMIG